MTESKHFQKYENTNWDQFQTTPAAKKAEAKPKKEEKEGNASDENGADKVGIFMIKIWNDYERKVNYFPQFSMKMQI